MDGNLQFILLLALIILIMFVGLMRLGESANEVDWGGLWLNWIDGLNRILCRRFHRLQHNEIVLPETGGALLVCNHISGLDPLLMIAACKRPLRFLIAREEYERFGLHWLLKGVGCIPVDRKGRPEQALREALRVLQQGEVVALFPHGHIHLDSDPPRRLKGGVIWLSQQTKAPIIPMRLTDVFGEGRTISAVFLPSRARLQGFAALDCAGEDGQACLQQIAEYIEGRGEIAGET
ncbi:MAG: 1-acyl-sn-glycerol-3-phosphate acyltransferase [Gammaproteobacteria bacterium]|nr:1-acyl-sn-glycerol-3-phosphate acyltransferase [Gammaproteobacteria bacterium]